jgi:rubredoxin
MAETIDMVLHCPVCGMQHVDAPEPESGWTNPPHKSHLCHNCGCIWRPAGVPTNGVAEVERGSNDNWPTAEGIPFFVDGRPPSRA